MDGTQRLGKLQERVGRASVIHDKIQRLNGCDRMADVPSDLAEEVFNAGKVAVSSLLQQQLQQIQVEAGEESTAKPDAAQPAT
jgi:hypothetical protein